MVQITNRAQYFFEKHGWTEADLEYITENAFDIHDEDGWAMPMVRGPDGDLWLYPVSESDTFPISLWKKIKKYIEDEPAVVIPMSRNTDKVRVGAARYNGYLLDNLYLFGDKFNKYKELKDDQLGFPKQNI